MKTFKPVCFSENDRFEKEKKKTSSDLFICKVQLESKWVNATFYSLGQNIRILLLAFCWSKLIFDFIFSLSNIMRLLCIYCWMKMSRKVVSSASIQSVKRTVYWRGDCFTRDSIWRHSNLFMTNSLPTLKDTQDDFLEKKTKRCIKISRKLVRHTPLWSSGCLKSSNTWIRLISAGQR